ncbi:MAG: glutathione S-transferase family protein [Rhodospirillales bacterium]|nr:MAG: glutathione S-transferase family protein [Rhodospirillales bacterium]
MSDRLTIYGTARTRAMRAIWMAEELGRPYDIAAVDATAGGDLRAALLAANPNGRVPTVDDGGFTVWESMAVNLYLAKKYGGALYPASLEGEARAWQWSFWAVTEIDQPIIDWARHSFVLPPAERDRATAAAALLRLDRPLSALEAHLGGAPWIGEPDRFTVADLNAAATMYRALAMDLSARPRVADWLQRCWDRPAAKRTRAMRE